MVMAVAAALVAFALISFWGRGGRPDESGTVHAGGDDGMHTEWRVNEQTDKHGRDACASASSSVRVVAPPEGTADD